MGIHRTQEAPMRTAEHPVETEQVRRLSENLMSQLAKGREWATPGVQAALQKQWWGWTPASKAPHRASKRSYVGWLTNWPAVSRHSLPRFRNA
jgi:hypothetical protein